MEVTEAIRKFLSTNGASSRSEIAEAINFSASTSTLVRILEKEVISNRIIREGSGRGVRYSLMPSTSRRYPDGIQTFEEIIHGGYVYIDKTALVHRLVNSPSRSIFLSRPRRFGKSLLISTLKSYFEGRSELFDGLAIGRMEKTWKKFPVIRLDLSTAGDSMNEDQLRIKLNNIISESAEALGITVTETLPGERLNELIRKTSQQYSSKVVLLIDEYDAPILGTIYDETTNAKFRKIVKEFFSPIKKLEPYLRFTFLTGITKFSQISIFSTLNNLNDISMDDEFAAICGFTQKEVSTSFEGDIAELAIAMNTDAGAVSDRLKLEYDGYHFSRRSPDIYNPFSVLKAFAKKELSKYWFTSGTPSILIDTLHHFNSDICDIDGAEMPLSMFNQPTEAITSPIPLFYQSGYLTIRSYDALMDTYILAIPNGEVRSGLMENLVPIATGRSSIETQNLAIRFKKALLVGDFDGAILTLKAFFASIPYPEFGEEFSKDFEQKEAYFKRLIYLAFSFMSIQIHTEVMNSQGRTDAVITLGNAIYVMEAKLDIASATDAIRQIEAKGYATRFLDGRKEVYLVGLVFSSKTRTISDWKIVKCAQPPKAQDLPVTLSV